LTSARSRSKRRAKPRRAASSSSGDVVVCTLRLERLAAGGDAVAVREDGKTIFVEDGVPGDLVRARIVDERRRFARARIDEILEPGRDRVAPRCPHFGACGGCAWQQVRYEAQVEAKAAILRDALERIGGFALDRAPHVTPSPRPFGYRGRARVRVRGGRVGFLGRASDRLCAIESCPVLVPALEEAVLDPALVPRDPASEGEWSVCVGSDGAVSVASASGSPAAVAPAPVHLDVGERSVRLDARAFSQANVALYEALTERVRAVLFEGADDPSEWSLLEVHAGIGFFTGMLAGVVARVVAVESDPIACEWLVRNTPTSRVELIDRSFEDAALALEGRRFDAVLLDPPRLGLAQAELSLLCELAPPRVVYLSCDPATLARDARGLAEAGYRLDLVEGFDLFPQTPHTEGLARLVRD